MKIKISELKRISEKILNIYGYSSSEVATIMDILMYAQLRGNNQGVIKLLGKNFLKDANAGVVEIVRETKLSVLLNGNYINGMLVMMKALEIGITKAKEHGFAIVGTNNTNTSIGAAGYYASKVAEEQMIGFVHAGTPPLVAPFGSYEPVFGTNPIAIGIPATSMPIIYDMTTAAMPFFGLVEANTSGKSIPDNIAFDKEGNITTDPKAAIEGALKTFDSGYKGSGLSMIIEILTGPLVHASFGGIGDVSKNWGNIIYIIDPELLVDIDQFRNEVTQLQEKVKKSKKLPKIKDVYNPGERGTQRHQISIDSEELEIDKSLYDNLVKIVT